MLNIDEYLKDPNSIKCCCNRCNKSFLNNYYGHKTTGGFNITDNEKFRQHISKLRKYPEPKQINFQEAREEIQTGIDQFIKRILNDKDINESRFLEWKGHAMSSVDEKIHIKNKIVLKSVKSTFCED